MIKSSTRSQALAIPLRQCSMDVNTNGCGVATGNTASVWKIKVSGHAYIHRRNLTPRLPSFYDRSRLRLSSPYLLLSPSVLEVHDTEIRRYTCGSHIFRRRGQEISIRSRPSRQRQRRCQRLSNRRPPAGQHRASQHLPL
ncbi:hypothetical protein BOTBODRAFT_212982 [Botryobasidium botryosum FD-172 SS1]|uniref:Uncharacterized protein n=1 Tax=Botryobasidium botryosum (strain FD-172 SS1) TaxID=930990 RepID=A0A067NDA5_BOTB1|nr:hypothetical protein BOTBODRAFT_212982 [Botryobasidium botryosum FD-172 SS1]